MKKDQCRDYVVAMFRFYARTGQPDRTQINNFKTQLSSAAILDLIAVEETLRSFREKCRNDIIEAVVEVYFYCPSREIRKNEISRRVLSFSHKHNIEERSVYRMLHTARVVCAEKRNLNQ